MMENSVKNKKNSVTGKNGGRLTPFEKGQTGNQNGRPKLTDEEKKERLVLKYLETANSELVIELIESGEYKDLLLQAIKNTIEAGKVDGFKFLNDYNGNKPLDKTQVNANLTTTNIEYTKEERKEFLRKYLARTDS